MSLNVNLTTWGKTLKSKKLFSVLRRKEVTKINTAGNESVVIIFNIYYWYYNLKHRSNQKHMFTIIL